MKSSAETNTNKPAPWRLGLVIAIIGLSIKSFAQLEYRVGGRIQTVRADEKRSSELVCSMSLFFSVDREDRIEKRTVGSAEMEGRGLLSCKNPQGFATELPVLASLEADLPAPIRAPAAESPAATEPNELSFSVNSENFVIPREINQIYDIYNVRDFSWDKERSGSISALTLRGTRNDLVLGLKLTSKTAQISGLKVKTMRLSFDDKAPDLIGE